MRLDSSTFQAAVMIWTPDSSNTLVDARYRLVDLLQPFAAGVTEQFYLSQNGRVLHIPDTNSFVTAVYIMSNDYGMLVGSRRQGYFDLRVMLGKPWQHGLDKCLHALGASAPVTVVEVHTFALQDEGANAILAHCHLCNTGDSHILKQNPQE